MKASELRWGNFVQSKVKESMHFHRYISVSPVEILDCDRVGEDWAYEPIPLDEEWLLKLGFDNTNYGYIKRGDWGVLRIWEGQTTFCGSIIIEQKHVHQLQNLYFALTGEELTLKQ